MHTKGVASVRSPVRNIVQSTASVTHEAFVGAVIRSFKEEYAIDEEVSSRESHSRLHIEIGDAAMFRSRNVAISGG